MARKALVVHGGWAGHEPRQCVEVFIPFLREQGFEVVVSDTTRPYADRALMESLSLVVPCVTMGQFGEGEERGLLDAVRSGVGIAGWHGGMGDSYRTSCAYQWMVGGQFVEHPGGIIDYRITITDRLDPITAGIASFMVKTEQYYMHVDPGNVVLATSVFTDQHCGWIGGTVMPAIWKRPWGEGRVFYCSVGHAARDFEVPELRTIVQRGMLWAAR
jgi:hypothetical protein